MSHKQVIVVRKDLNMRKGKIASQVAHASMKAILDQGIIESDVFTLQLSEDINPWITGQFTKVCVYVNSEQELLDIYQRARTVGLITALIQDSGRTEFNGIPTYTTVAVGPAPNADIDQITGELPLL